jgi:hypothetical protein
VKLRITPAAAADGVSVIGYVVVVRNGGMTNAPRGLTNSDLMDEATAEHEAEVWRHKASERESGRKFEVCPVIGGER